jgi:hypothetical protein
LRWLGSIAAALILLTGFGMWRLMQGPIELDGLTPYVEAALNRSIGGWHVALTGAQLGIDHETRQLDLRIEGVRLSRPDGEPFAAFPEMVASFSLRALLLGRLAPTRIVVERPMVRLQRDANGLLQLQFGDRDAAAMGIGPELLQQLAGPPRLDAPLGLLRRVAVRDAVLILDDRQTGRVWQASRVDATAARGAEGIDGDLSLAVPIGGQVPEVHASWRYSAPQQTLDLALDIGEVEPAALAPLLPDLAPLAAFDLPVSGSLRTRIDVAALRPEGFRLDLGLGTGSIVSELLPRGTLGVQQGELHAVYAPESEQLHLLRLRLDLGGGSLLSLDGSLDGVTPELIAGDAPPAAPLSGKLHTVLSNVPVANFDNLWPRALSRGGRRWVLANIRDGVLDRAAFELGVTVDVAARSADIVSTHGTLRYHDLTVNYLDGLPPVRKVGGTATLADKRLEFTPTGGAVKSVQVTGGSLVITDLGSPVEWLSIDLALAGPIQDALDIIDAKPLHYAHDIGIEPGQVSGRVQTNLHFKLPLLDKVKFDQVDYGVKASLVDVAVDKIALDRGLSDGNLALEIARSGVHLQGTARFDGTPATLDASLAFKPKAGPRGRYHVALDLDDEARRRLDMDFLHDRVAGPVGVDLTYSTFADGHAEGAVAVDLRRAGLSVAEAGWKKPPDVPATAKLTFDLEDEHLTRLRGIEIKAPGLDGRFAVALAPDPKRIDRVDIQHLTIADSELSGTVSRRREGGWHIELRGPRLDVSHLLEDVNKDSANAPPVQIDARLGRLVLGPRHELSEVSGEILRDGRWRSAHIDGRFANGHRLSLRLAEEEGKNGLRLQSDDFGSTLDLLDITGNIVGGQVTVTGQLSDDGMPGSLRGHVEAENYNLVRAPGFARVLSLASLTAVGSLLGGSGIPFTTLRGDFVYRSDRLVLDQLLAYGGAIGVTASGTFDFGRDRLDLQGTIVPAYTLNSILGNVPVIGSLLLGGEGQGLFAANYRVTGSGADPQVSVNPLSVLTPGFLRKLFQLNLGASPSPEQAPAPAPADER